MGSNILKAKWQGIPVILIIGILAFVPFFSGNSAADLALDWFDDAKSGAIGGLDYKTSMVLTSVTSGVTENNENPSAVILTMTSADLNSENDTTITATINQDRSDLHSDYNSAYPIFPIELTDARSYTGWTTPESTFHTVDYSSSTKYYNVTIDGRSIALSNSPVNEAVAQGTTTSTVVTMVIPNYTELNAQLVEQDHNSAVLGGFRVSDPSGNTEHTIKVVYLKS